MNKKLVKKVAVASLAALMTIPNLTISPNNINTVFASTTGDKNMKHAKEMIEKFTKEGNSEAADRWAKKLEEFKVYYAEEDAKTAQRAAKQSQLEANRQAEQAEKDRIANTVYPLTAKYVKDFVPAVNDYQPHFYERPELPGVIFTLQQDSFGRLTDVKPNMKIEKLSNLHHESSLFGHEDWTIDNTDESIKVTYISPFNCVIGAPSIGDFNQNGLENGFFGEWCHWIGENTPVIMSRVIEKRFKSGWPDYYIGKSVAEITEKNCDPNYGYLYSSETTNDQHFGQISYQEAIDKAKVIFNTKEKVDINIDKNNAAGANWVGQQTIYSVAREHGTD